MACIRIDASVSDLDTCGQVCANFESVQRTKQCESRSVCKIEIKEDGSHVEIDKDGVEKPLEGVQMNLHDCLGCNGCVQEDGADFVQSRDVWKDLIDLLDASKSSEKTLVVSLSRQSLASLAVHFNLALDVITQKFVAFLNSYGVARVLDLSLSIKFALIESANEFIARKKAGQSMPVLCSACPGLVDYLEAAHPQLLPNLSTVKSPQQIQGSFVKSAFASEKNLVHIAVMPCIDHREESRNTRFRTEDGVREVDLVVTPKAIGVDITSLPASPLNEDDFLLTAQGKLEAPSGGPSDGFLEFILQHAAKELHGDERHNVKWTLDSRNGNLKEAQLEVNGKAVLRFALAYGFRQMQTFIRQIKRGQCEVDYIEFMACPGGCTNGGGQIAPEKNENPQERLARVTAAYFGTSGEKSTLSDGRIEELYSRWVGDDASLREKYMHTTFAPKAAEKKSSGSCGCAEKMKFDMY